VLIIVRLNIINQSLITDFMTSVDYLASLVLVYMF